MYRPGIRERTPYWSIIGDPRFVESRVLIRQEIGQPREGLTPHSPRLFRREFVWQLMLFNGDGAA